MRRCHVLGHCVPHVFGSVRNVAQISGTTGAVIGAHGPSNFPPASLALVCLSLLKPSVHGILGVGLHPCHVSLYFLCTNFFVYNVCQGIIARPGCPCESMM